MNLECKECKKTTRNFTTIRCGGSCGHVFHQHCIGDKYILKALEEKQYLCVLCIDCKNFLKSINVNVIEVNQKMKELDNKINNQSVNLKELSDALQNINKNSQHVANDRNRLMRPTYAEKLKDLKNHEPVVILKPKLGNQDANKTKSEMIEKIDPIGIQVSQIKSRGNGAVLVSCENEQSVEKLKRNMEQEMGEHYEVGVPKVRDFRVKLFGLPTKYTGDELIKQIKDKNKFLEFDDIAFKVIYEQKMQNQSRYNAIFEVKFESFKKIMQAERLGVGLGKYRVLEALYVKRCYKCLGFNHHSSQCKRHQTCSHCTGEHKFIECENKNEIPKCVNCSYANQNHALSLQTNHNSFDHRCLI